MATVTDNVLLGLIEKASVKRGDAVKAKLRQIFIREDKSLTAHNKENQHIAKNIRTGMRKENALNPIYNDFDWLFNEENLLKLEHNQLINIQDLIVQIDNLDEFVLGTNAIYASTYQEALNYTLNALKQVTDIYRSEIELREKQDEIQKGIEALEDGKSDKGLPSREEIAIINAFRLTGANITREDNKWVLKSIEEIKIQGQIISFDENSVRGVINYLNSGKKDKNITAEGILTVFRDLALQKFPDKQSVTDILGRTRLEELISSEYSTDSNQFKQLVATDEMTVILDSEIEALVLEYDRYLTDNPESGLNDDLSETNNSYINDDNRRLLRKLYKLEDFAVKSKDRFIELSNNFTLSHISDRYKGMIRSLYSRGREQEAKVIENILQQAENRAIVMDYFKIHNTPDGFDINSPEVVEKFINDNQLRSNAGNVNNHTLDTLNNASPQQTPQSPERPQSKTSIAPTQENTVPNIFSRYFTVLEGEETNAIVAYQKLHLARYLCAEDQIIGKKFTEFVGEYQPVDGENVIDAFVERYLSEEFQSNPDSTSEDKHLLDAETLTLALEINNPSMVQDSQRKQDSQEKRNKIENDYNDSLLILDQVALKLAKGDEYFTYPDGEARDKRLKQLINETREQIQKLSEDEKRKLVEKAQKRQSNPALKKMTESYLDEVSGVTPENEGEQKNKTALETALKKYIDDISEEQKGNNQELQNQGEPVLSNSEEQTNEQQEQQEEEELRKYNELNKENDAEKKFKEAMKKYCGKALVKKFLKPLEKKLKNTKVIPSKKKTPSIPTNSNSTTTTQSNANNIINPTGSRQSLDATVTAENSTKVTIGKREFEASVLMTAYAMIKNEFSKDGKYEQGNEILDKLDTVLLIVSSLDEALYYKQDEKGNDIRDALREIIFDIARKKYKTFEEVENSIDKALSQYSIKNDTFRTNIVNGFKFITDYSFSFLLTPCSKLNLENNTLVLGGEDGFPVEALSKCQNDEERYDIISKYYIEYKKNNPNGEMLDALRDMLMSNSQNTEKKESYSNIEFAYPESPAEISETEAGDENVR